MLPVFAATLFVCAFLLFLVQPMVGKMILPTMGGTPAVWNTCMVFFQAALLAGYAYAHGTIAWFGVRRQAAVHVLLLFTPLLVLPIVMVLGNVPQSSDNPELWLFGRLVIGVGLPFFAVSTSAPLLQRWFADTGHNAGRDPYFLYAASNAGSILALLAYPLIVEPRLDLAAQSTAWTIAYVVMLAMVFCCAVLLWRSPKQRLNAGELDSTIDAARSSPPLDPPSMVRRGRWVLLAFVPSSLMLGVTTKMTTDIAPVPLLWVLPLAVYLLTFIVVFARHRLCSQRTLVRVLPVVVVFAGVMSVQDESRLGAWALLVHLLAFLVTALACHGALAEDRPAAIHLTEFYLLMSVGGVLGGLFNAFVGPMLFNSIAEYPLVLVLACLALDRRARRLTDGEWMAPLLVVILAVASVLGLWSVGKWSPYPTLLTVTLPAGICLLLMRRTFHFGVALGGVMLAISFCGEHQDREVIYAGRNFYGVKRVYSHWGDQLREFAHGSTPHGLQFTGEQNSQVPCGYYHPAGPLGDVFRMYRNWSRQGPVAVIGLGVGSTAAYARPGQEFVFYEIDPEVARIAADPRYFTHLVDMKGEYSIVLGDGRLTLQQAPDGYYSLLIIDAFNSDAIPTHMLTREAFQLYFTKTAADGAIVLHASNRFLDLTPLLGNLAAEADAYCMRRADVERSRDKKMLGKFPSDYVVIAREQRQLQTLSHMPAWRELRHNSSIAVWTDQYSNVFSLFRRLGPSG